MSNLRLSLTLGGLLACLTFTNAGARSVLADYFEATASVIPNKFSLSLSQEFTYSDNVNTAPNRDKRDAFSTNTVLSCSLLRELQNGIVYGLESEVSYEWYDDKETNDNNTSLQWNINPKLRGDFNLFGSDSIELSLRTESHYEAFDSTDGTKTRTQTFGGSLLYDYTGGQRLGFAFIADYEYTHYLDSDYKDDSNHEYELSFAPYYKLTPSTKLGLRLAYGETIYRDNTFQDDSETVTLNAFADYRLNETISAHAEAGFERVSYSGRASDSDESDTWSPDASLSITYRPVSNVSFTYATSYGLEDTRSTASRGARKVLDNSLRMTWNMTSRIALTQGISYEMTDEKNGNFQDSGELVYDIRADYAVCTRVSVYLGYEYRRRTYDYQHREDYHVNEWTTGLRCSF
ncbi:MAG: hypothetical protein ACI4WT_08830 [Oligosphaeraceae bacterium]